MAIFNEYEEKTIDKMCKLDNRGYFKSLINMEDIPSRNMMSLLLMKIKECKQEANQEILDVAVKRREMYND